MGLTGGRLETEGWPRQNSLALTNAPNIVAALDVGTNTVLMLVVQSDPKGGVHRIADLSRITRLGRGVDKSGRFDPQSVALTLNAISDFVDEARRCGAQRILGVATSAVRDAIDGGDFIARVKQRTGVELAVISGRTEAELSYLAVMRGLDLDPASRLLIVDIGGGSTEFIRSEPAREISVASLDIGSVRLTERLIHHDPPAAAEEAAIVREVDAEIKRLGWNFRPDVTVGIAGTATTIAAVVLGLRSYEPGRVHGFRLAREQVRETLSRFGSLALAERRKLPGLVEGRADVIYAGTVVLWRVMVQFDAPEVVVSDQGVRWGLVWRELGLGHEVGGNDQG